MRGVIAFLSILILAGCTAVYQREAVFDPNEFEPFRQPGNCTIKGQASLRTRGGEDVTSAGQMVVLYPSTSYTREWFQKSVLDGKALSKADPRLLEYRRVTKADGDGNFTFEKLPAGDYFIVCPIRGAPMRMFGTLKPCGIACRSTSVKDGELQSVSVRGRAREFSRRLFATWSGE